MTKRRTKKDLMRAKQRRASQVTKQQIKSKMNPVMKNSTEMELIHYDPKLIVHDLIRTVIATLVVFGALVALYFQL